MSYMRFSAMILFSTIVMYGLMYLNTYSADHIWFSQTRLWMALLMGAAMAEELVGRAARRDADGVVALS